MQAMHLDLKITGIIKGRNLPLYLWYISINTWFSALRIAVWREYAWATYYQIQICELNWMFENIKCSIFFLQVPRNILQFFSKDIFMNRLDKHLPL